MRTQKLLLLLCLIISPFQLQANDPPPPPVDLLFAPPGSELWKDIRQRDAAIEGTSQVKSDGANVLINVAGEDWRQYRVNELIPKSAAGIFIVLAIIVIFRLIRGKVALENGRSGEKIQRFTDLQRYAHWVTAILFVILGVTGLVLMLGRMFLLPMFGPKAFGGIAIFSKTVHDYLGPLFMISLTVLFVLFVKDNLPSLKLDIQWVLKGGGLFGKHVNADRFNAGEKLWFWVASIGGLAVIISGMVLDFPIFGQTRETMEFYLFVHGIAAIVLILFAFGHIYMGTLALEATFEVMQTGYCDTNWAKEHHNLWYEKVKGGDVVASAPESASPAGAEESAT